MNLAPRFVLVLAVLALAACAQQPVAPSAAPVVAKKKDPCRDSVYRVECVKPGQFPPWVQSGSHENRRRSAP